MLYALTLVALLITLAGVIAYAGDVLGTAVGRRRLSLFGWRPKRTGKVVAVSAGVLIMLTTLGTLALAFRGATGVLLDAQRAAAERDTLWAEQRRLQSSLGELQGRLDMSANELVEAQILIDDTESNRQLALEMLAETNSDNERFLRQQQELLASLENLSTTITRLEAQQREQERELARVQQDLADARQEREEAFAARDDAVQEVAGLERQMQATQDRMAEVSDELAGAQRDLSQAREALQAARRARDEAQVERAAVVAELGEVVAERDRAIQEASELSRIETTLTQQIEQTRSEFNDLVSQANTLQQQNQALSANNERLVQTVASLEEQIPGFEREIDLRAQQLVSATEQLRAIEQQDLAYQVGELVYSGLLRAQEANAIRVELSEMISSASSEALRKGAGSVTLGNDQFESLVQSAAETPGPDLVTLYSRSNQFVGQPVAVRVESLENHELLTRGQLLVSRQIHLGSADTPISQEEIRTELQRLVTDATNKLQRIGLSVQQGPALGAIGEESFSAQLRRLRGPVVIGMVAKEAIFVSGPAEVELVILYGTPGTSPALSLSALE